MFAWKRYLILGACLWSAGLGRAAPNDPEAQRAELVERLMTDQLYYSAQRASAVYLVEFPQGRFQEKVAFAGARAAELYGHNLAEALTLYQNFRLRYPQSSLAEAATLATGYLNIQTQNYNEAFAIFTDFRQRFPQSQAIAQLDYWTGKAYFQQAETARKDKSENAPKLYAQAVQTLQNVVKSESLNDSQTADTFYLLGWAFHYQNNASEAEKWWLKYAEKAKDPEQGAAIYSQLGQTALQAERFEEAKGYFETIIQQFPQASAAVPARFWKAESDYAGWVKTHDKKTTPASLVDLYQAYLSTKDKAYWGIAQYRLATLLSETKRPKEAIAAYQEYLQSEEKTYRAEAHYRLGELLMQTGEAPDAIAQLQEAQKHEKYRNHALLMQTLVQLYEKTNQTEEKEKLLNTAKNNTALDEKQRALFQLQAADASFKNKDCEKVLSDLQQLPKGIGEKEMYYFQYLRGSCAVQKQQWKLAEGDLNAIKKATDYEKSVLDLLVMTYQSQAEWKKLTATLEEAAKNKQELRGDHFRVMAYAYTQLQQWKSVISAYTRWEAQSKQEIQDPEALVNWANAEEQLQNWEPSKKRYERALSKMTPETDLGLRESVVLKLGDLYAKGQDYEGLTRIYEKYWMPALKEKKARKKYALILGKLYYSPLKQYEKAKSWLEEADDDSTSDEALEAAFVRSNVEKDQGQPEAALNLLKKLDKRAAKSPKWLIPIHYQMALIYEAQRQSQAAIAEYQIVAKAPVPQEKEQQELQKAAKSRVGTLESFASSSQLEELVKKKAWPEVSRMIREGLEKKTLSPQNALFQTLVVAENEKKDWKGLLNAYELWGKFEKSKPQTLEALVDQGQAAEQLGQVAPAKNFYEKAWAIVPTKETNTRLFLASRLGAFYESANEIKKATELYEKTYSFLPKGEEQRRMALKIGLNYLNALKQEEAAKNWLEKADQGGTSEDELQALWNLASLDEKAKQPEQASRRLAKAASRKIAEKSPWYVLVNYKLAQLYHTQEKWQEAKLHYDRVTKASVSDDQKKYQEDAKEQSQRISEYLKQVQGQ